jgi:endonuclease YncB( thermonuclease family)
MPPTHAALFMRRLCTGLALLAALGAAAATLPGRVEKVIDGDSLVFRPDAGGAALEVRLKGIDAPEGCQDGGPEAREYLREFVHDKPATLVTLGKDSYGRTLGELKVDGMLVNQRLVAEGHAWSLRGRSNQGVYVKQEKVAMALKRGLHATLGAIPPWDFRRRHGRCGSPQPPTAAIVAPVSQPPAPLLAAPGLRCDGRTHCSQMRSCAEAEYFLAHCPGVKMDGNRDGVPCERQWCGR